jgi:hypothetical protein
MYATNLANKTECISTKADGASGRHYMSSQIFHFFSMHWCSLKRFLIKIIVPWQWRHLRKVKGFTRLADVKNEDIRKKLKI